jgi:hypothetical protein
MNILKKISNLLPASQREAIKSIFTLIKRQYDVTNARRSEFEARRLLSKIAQGEKNKVLIPSLARSGAKISSEEHNDNMESAFIDLYGLYRQVAFINSVQDKQVTSIIDDFNKAKASVLKLINDARVFAVRSRTPEFDDIKLIDFNVVQNFSTLRPRAKVDLDTRLLKLPEVIKRRNALERRGLRTTATSAEVIGAQKGKLGGAFPTANAVDTKPESFWGEVLYTEIPTQQSYNRATPDNNGVTSYTVDGPIVKFKLNFSSAEPVNQVKILPFGTDPIKILEITYKPSTASLIEYSIPDFVVEESLDWMEFNFETIFVSEINVILAQENFRELLISVDKSILYATDFLVRLQETRAKEIADIPNLKDTLIGGNSEIYEQALDDLSELMSYKELEKSPITEIDLAGQTVLSIGEVLSKFNPNLSSLVEEVSNFTDTLPASYKSDVVTLQRYEYVVGAREIECNFVVYAPLGSYESAEFSSASNIVNTEIEVDERHPVFSGAYGSFKKTSTEWSVEFASDRAAPIFPRNQVNANGECEIRDELVFFDLVTKSGETRFNAKYSAMQLFENGELLSTPNDYTATWLGGNGKLGILVDTNRFDIKKLYTISYYASDASKSIDVQSMFSPKYISVPEIFEEVGPDNDILLSTYPYVNFSAINHPAFSYNTDENNYVYNPPINVITSGMIRAYPKWQGGGVTLGGTTGQPYVYGVQSGWFGYGSGNEPFTGANGGAWSFPGDIGAAVHAMPDFSGMLDTQYSYNPASHPYSYYIQFKDIGGAVFRIIDFNPSVTGRLGLDSGDVSVTGLNGDPGPGYGGDYTPYSGRITLEQTPVMSTGLLGDSFSYAGFTGTTGLSGYGTSSGNLTKDVVYFNDGDNFDGYLTIPYKIFLAIEPKKGGGIFGINGNFVYDPIDITIGGTKAKNITEYHKLQQNAFNLAGNIDGEYEFIHDRRTIYFNQPISASEIQVNYQWMTKYVKIKGFLRANKIVSPTVTPQVNELRLLMHTSVL